MVLFKIEVLRVNHSQHNRYSLILNINTPPIYFFRHTGKPGPYWNPRKTGKQWDLSGALEKPEKRDPKKPENRDPSRIL